MLKTTICMESYPSKGMEPLDGQLVSTINNRLRY